MIRMYKASDQEWMSLPTSSTHIYHLYQKGKRHPAMKMANSAIKIGRSPNQVFFLLVGLTGAGKSSTINYLFEKDIAPTSDFESKTRSTEEFVVTMKSDAWRIPDLKLSLIDTPGFSDTQGLEQDAKNVLSIQTFLKKHEYLKGNFPNIVFVVLDGTDKRIAGTDSQFAKMLKGLRHIEAVDHNNPNVVVVLTHAAALVRNPRKWTEQAERKKAEVKAIVELNLGVTPEVAFQENLPEDNDLEKSHPWYLLPNREKQPKNLFEACKRILSTSEDEIGYEAMAVCFRSGKIKSIEKGLATSSLDLNKRRVGEMYSVLLQSVVMVSKSEVGNMLEDYKNKSKENTTIQNDILLLQVKLRDINIESTKAIQSMTMNTLVSKMYPVRINGKMEKILEHVFGIKYEQLSGHDYHIGRGYNLFNDTKTTMQPLVLSGSGGKFGLPDNVLLRECSCYDIKCQAIKTTNEHIGNRLKDVSVNVEGTLNYKLFNMKMQHGYNMDNSVSSATSERNNRSSFSVEQKMYKVEIAQPFLLNPELKRDINALPNSYNLEVEDNVNLWKAFFDKWGYYVITGAYIGGSLSGQVITSEAKTTEKACEDAQMALAVRLSYLQNKGEFDLTTDKSQSTSQSSSTNLQSTSIHWNGGDKALHKNSLENISSHDWNRWIESLENSPAALWTSLDVYPMYQLAAEISQVKSMVMHKTLNLALTGKLSYSPPEPDTRETVGKSKASDEGCFHPMSTVTMSNGKGKLIKDLAIGDQVLILDNNKRVVTDVIVSWLHKKTQGVYCFLKITHNKGYLCLTPEHILFVADSLSSKLASSIEPGNKLVYFQTNSSGEKVASIVTVLSITEINATGIYAPLTRSGRIMVDGITASCYCSISSIKVFGQEIISSHSLAHFGLLPLRIAHHVGANAFNTQMDEKSGINKYAQWLSNKFLDYLQ